MRVVACVNFGTSVSPGDPLHRLWANYIKNSFLSEEDKLLVLPAAGDSYVEILQPSFADRVVEYLNKMYPIEKAKLGTQFKAVMDHLS